MYAVNRAVDMYNRTKFNEHLEASPSAKPITLCADYKDLRSKSTQSKYPVEEWRIKKVLDESPLAHNEPIALGARVLITMNGYMAVNGDTGDVMRVPENETDVIRVRLDRTGKEVSIGVVDMGVKNPYGGEDAKVSGYPVRLGYAVTVHKSQGMTLPRAIVDMSSIKKHPPDSRHGLAYVALSRTVDAESLFLSSWARGAVHTDPQLLPYIDALS
jgi:ATP-dependent exoDNAse (exonuclease V) alpha subunit